MDTKNSHEADAGLIEFFKYFESIMEGGVPNIDQVASGTDFYVFKEYLVNDIHDMQQRLGEADDAHLIETCEHLYNILEWIRLINGNRTQTFGDALERVFEQEFGDKHILQNLYTSSIDRWLLDKNGQHKIGGNVYTILGGAFYYRDRFKQWFRVEKETAFDLQPNRQPLDDEVIITQLESTYHVSPYEKMIEKWNNQNFQGELPDNFLQFNKDITSPEEYFDFTLPYIKSLLHTPVSIKELERWYGSTIDNLEETIKLGTEVIEIVEDRRKQDNHTVYLLRDCLVFYEVHKTLDLLNSEDTSSDQLLIGRNLLSHKEGKWGYYIVTLEALYEAHKRYPDDYDEFYAEYVRLLDIFAEVNPSFVTIINNLAVYIKKHIQTNKQKVIIFDVGFQGSINLLIKYIIDRHINPTADIKKESDIAISIGAQWSKDLFKNRFRGDYFPFLNRVQYMARSDELYHYEYGSLNDGNVRVKMGDQQWQRKAAAELVVFVMIAKLSRELPTK